MMTNYFQELFLRPYNKLTRARLVETPSVSSPSPTITTLYKTSDVSYGGLGQRNAILFSDIEVGSTPNCVIFDNNDPVWSEAPSSVVDGRVFDSVYDMLNSVATVGTQAVVGYKTFDFRLYPAQLNDKAMFHYQNTLNLPDDNLDNIYQAISDTGVDFEYMFFTIITPYTTLYYVRKDNSANLGFATTRYYSLDKLFSMALDTTEANGGIPLEFPVKNNLTIRPSTIKLEVTT